jgi:membrane-bound lytic murein transglycosylase A
VNIDQNRYEIMSFKKNNLILLLGATLSACSNEIIKQPPMVKPSTPPVFEKKADPAIQEKSMPCDCEQVPKPVKPSVAKETPTPLSTVAPDQTITDLSLLKPASWAQLEEIFQQSLSDAWPAWMQSCSALKTKIGWQSVCEIADSMNTTYAGKPSIAAVSAYFQSHFNAYQMTNSDGTDKGMITGYYEPTLSGSKTKSATYQFPLYHQPDDLITVSLESLFPELMHKRVRGRVVGDKLIPYFTRAEIETNNSPIQEHAFVYIDDIIDVFFLQIQGSGLIKLDNGEALHVGYANQNGHDYRSIGKILIENGQIKASEASMQGIKNWAIQHPDQLRLLLNKNPSYVFFRELPQGLPGPIGALGVPLLAKQAIAVDKKYIPLGAPVFLSTTEPNSQQPLKKLMMAQDTGGAIKGGVRADFYWGSGDTAGKMAGAMKQVGQMWVLLPNQMVVPK